MSFVSGKLGASGTHFETTDGEKLSLNGGRASAFGGAVEAGIRPEHFVISSTDAAMKLKIDVVEPTGSETHIYGSVGGEQVRAVFRDRVSVKPGETLPVTADPKNIHLFDKATGLPV